MSKFGQRVKHLVGEMIPPALFFFLAFQLLALTQALMLRQYDINAPIFVAGLVGALVVAKVVVLADTAKQATSCPPTAKWRMRSSGRVSG